MYKILISEKVSNETIEFLETHGIKVKVGTSLEHKVVYDEIQDCDAVMVRMMRIDRDIIAHAPKLKVIAKHGAGCDSIDTEAAFEFNIPVVYAPGANALSVAEHTLTLMLSCAHCVRQANLGYAEGDYHIKDVLPIFEISGKTIGLIGCGNVALHVAKIAHCGFDMRILGYDPLTNRIMPSYIQMTETVDELIAESDFISIHIPGTDENTNYFDVRKFSLMKNTAFLINTSRGNVIDTQALLNYIKTGKIAGAGLDVSNPEPAISDSELFTMRNILLTPHIGAASQESMIRMGRMAAEGVVDVLYGRIPKYKYC